MNKKHHKNNASALFLFDTLEDLHPPIQQSVI